MIELVASRRLHAGRPGDVLPDVVVVILARGHLDDAAQHQEAGVGVAPARARLELQRLVLDQGHEVAHGAEAGAGGVHEGLVEVVAEAARVREQMLDADAGGRLRRRELRQERRQRLVEGQVPALHELGNGHGGEHLVHGAEVELRIDAVGDREVLAGLPVRPLEDDLVAARQGDGAREAVRGDQVSDGRLHGRANLSVRVAFPRRFRRRRDGRLDADAVDAIRRFVCHPQRQGDPGITRVAAQQDAG